MSLANATSGRPVCLPGYETQLKHVDFPSGSELDPSTERASDPSHRATPNHSRDRPTPPQRHPNDPSDPCASFSTDSSPGERSHSHARIVWMVAALNAALEQSGEARSLPTTDVHEPSPCPSDTLEAALPTEPLTPSPIPDSRLSSAQPIFPNRHMTEDEQGTSSKFPEVKGDGALPSDPDPRLGQDTEGSDDMHGHEGTNGSPDYEPATAPSSTDHPLPEHMVNAAEPVGRGVMIRAGSGLALRSVAKVSSVHLNTCLPIKKHRPLHRIPMKRRRVNSGRRMTESRARTGAHLPALLPRTYSPERPKRQKPAGRRLNHPYPMQKALRTRWTGLLHDHTTPRYCHAADVRLSRGTKHPQRSMQSGATALPRLSTSAR